MVWSINEETTLKENLLYGGSSEKEAKDIAKKSVPSLLTELYSNKKDLTIKHTIYRDFENINEVEKIFFSNEKIREICEPFKEEILEIGKSILEEKVQP